MVCSGTATMNASTTYLTEKDLLRDYVHATDLARVILSYTWYARLAGVEQLEEIKLDAIPEAFLKSTKDKTMVGADAHIRPLYFDNFGFFDTLSEVKKATKASNSNL